MAATLDDVMQALATLRREMQAEIDGLKAAVAVLEARQAAPAPAPVPAEAISPDLLVIMAAAVTSFLGRKVRIRSAKLVHAHHEGGSPWAQHGRVFVQAASHHLRRGVR